MLERLFRDKFDVVTALSGPEALEALAHYDAAVIISDQRMPEMTGIEFLQRASEIRRQTVRIILTGYTDVNDLVSAINSGVIYKYITKPWVNSDLMQTVQRAVEHYDATKQHHQLAQENDRLKERIHTNVDRLIAGMIEILAQRNHSLVEHCRRTANYSTLIAGNLGLDHDSVTTLTHAALLHELPNMRMPFDMGFNSSALTPDQYRVTRAAFDNGLQMISDVPDLDDTATIIRCQHEHFDGTGFFGRLEGEAIPLLSRILAVASAFDDLHSGRNPALLSTDEEAVEWLRKQSATLFDPQIVDACLSLNLMPPPDLLSAADRGRLGPGHDMPAPMIAATL